MSEITVKVADDEIIKNWDIYIEESSQGSVFHQYDFLRIMEKYSNSKLHLLTGYKGFELIGLFPIFEISKGLISAVFSPPPYLLIPYLGPVLLDNELLNQKKFETINNGLINGCLNWINKNIRPKFYYILTVYNYTDVRPFIWNGFNVNPKFTYIVNLKVGEEELWNNLYKIKRKNIRKCLKENVHVKIHELEAVNFISSQLKKRYIEQGEKIRVDLTYFSDIYNILPKDQVLPYLGEVDNRPTGGVIVFKYKDIAYGWQGSLKTEKTNLPFNDFVIWKILENSIKQELNEFDFVGANTLRLCNYKSQFSPKLNTYYEIKKSTKIMHFIEMFTKK